MAQAAKSEKIFYDILKEIFLGTQVEGKSGFINLMKIKSKFYEKILQTLREDIDEKLKEFPLFRKELFDKLFSFFKVYFSETGSVYFTNTVYKDNVYEQVYSDNIDVMLFWKTNMLYYVKSDIQTKSLDVVIQGKNFFIDASELESKKSWEKRELVYEFKEKEQNERIVLSVKYSEKGKKTKLDELIKDLQAKGIEDVNKDILDDVIYAFQKQNEVDFFINKNVNQFLKKKFSLWLNEYILSDKSQYNEKRIKELKMLQSNAFKIIDFISQFENELLKIWQKPKFVLDSYYVITLDRIEKKENGIQLIERIIKSDGIEDQVLEWQKLEIVKDGFNPAKIIVKTLKGKGLDHNFKTLPIDLKHFQDLKGDILALFDNLDEELDGWLIKSENWQALNTILPKFKEKVQTIYIDPPFIKVQDPDYYYKVNFKDATWLTLIQNRLELAKKFLKKTGSIFVCSDNSCDHYTRLVLNEIFQNFRAEIVWCYEKPGAGVSYFKNNHINIYFYTKTADNNYVFNQQYMARKGETELTRREGRFETDYAGKIAPDWWADIPSFATAMTARERMVKMLGISFPTQQPENLLKRVIQASSNEGDFIMDFFLGSGTSIAVAHKLKRKWIGIELGDHFDTVILPRMKITLSGKRKGKADTKMSEDIKWKGGGFFKYYYLEQYEQTLRRVKYGESDPFLKFSDDIYNQYIFMKDLKLLDALEIDNKENKVKIDLTKLYDNVDIAEVISNLTGKNIQTISEKSIILEDDTEINIEDLDFLLIKPLLWWES